MGKTKCKSKLYKLRLVKTDEPVLWGHNYSDEWDALCEAMLKDFGEEKVFEFVHPTIKGRAYSRHYIHPICNGYAALRVGQFKTSKDFAEVYINLVSKKYEPYVVLLNPSPAFANHDILADIVARAFNWELAGKKLKIVMEKWEPADGEAIEWIMDCIETYRSSKKTYDENNLKDFGFEKLMKPGSKRKTGNFRSYIKPGYEEKVISFLRKEIGESKDIAVFMRPMRAIARLDLFRERPPLNSFCEEFHKEGLIKISAYNQYMYTNNDKCNNDRAYYDVLKRASDYFGIIV